MISTDEIGGILSSRGNVIGPDGEKIGTVEQIFLEDSTGEPAWATVKTGLFGMSQSFVPLAGATTSGVDLYVSYSKEQVKDAPRLNESDGRISPAEEDQLYRYYGMSGTHENTTDTVSDVTTDRDYDRDVTTTGTTDDPMTRSEERLHVGTEAREVGKVRLRKYIVTENVIRTVPVSREEVRLEREPITDANAGDAVSGPQLTESEHEVTLHAEEPVVAKETVPVERVRLDKDIVSESITMEEEQPRESAVFALQAWGRSVERARRASASRSLPFGSDQGPVTERGAPSPDEEVEIQRVIARASEIWDEATVEDWLTGSNAFLDGARPIDVARLRGAQEVIDALDAEQSGSFA